MMAAEASVDVLLLLRGDYEAAASEADTATNLTYASHHTALLNQNGMSYIVRDWVAPYTPQQMGLFQSKEVSQVRAIILVRTLVCTCKSKILQLWLVCEY